MTILIIIGVLLLLGFIKNCILDFIVQITPKPKWYGRIKRNPVTGKYHKVYTYKKQRRHIPGATSKHIFK